MLRTVLRPTILGAGSNSASISLGAQSPEHRTHRRGVQTPELQRQRYQFVVARYDVGTRFSTIRTSYRRQTMCDGRLFDVSGSTDGTSTPISRIPRTARRSTVSGASARNPVGQLN